MYIWDVITIWAATRQNQQNEWAPTDDSDQPGHPPRLIRVFTARMKKAWVLSYPSSAQLRLIRLQNYVPRLIWVFAGRTVTLLDLSCRSSYGFAIGWQDATSFYSFTSIYRGTSVWAPTYMYTIKRPTATVCKVRDIYILSNKRIIFNSL